MLFYVPVSLEHRNAILRFVDGLLAFEGRDTHDPKIQSPSSFP